MAMDCQQLVDLTIEYTDGELAGDTRRRLETHLECCDGCVEFINAYQQTGDVCRQALAVQTPPAVKTTLLEFLRSELQSPRT